MTHAMHRLPLNAAPNSRRRAVSLAPVARSASLAAAAQVLATVREIGSPGERCDAAFLSATRLYDEGHWDFAFDRLALLADQGDAAAAKLALLMLRYGSALYGTSFAAQPMQVARWAQRVLRATSRPTASPSSITASA